MLSNVDIDVHSSLASGHLALCAAGHTFYFSNIVFHLGIHPQNFEPRDTSGIEIHKISPHEIGMFVSSLSGLKDLCELGRACKDF